MVFGAAIGPARGEAGAVLAAMVCAATVTLAGAANADDSGLDTEVMGGTGVPILPAGQLGAVDTLYIQPNLPGTDPVPLSTPEQFSPLSGTMTLDESVAQGVADLNTAIAPDVTAGTPVGVFGVSQSAIVASLEMEQLDPSGTQSSLPVDFVLTGDPMNPDGGVMERFPGLDILGATFYGATPGDDFSTVIYTHEYDAFADFCQYPVDVVCDVNAVAGIANHDYGYLTAAQVDAAIPLATQGATETTYYMIPSELPLVTDLQSIPAVGDLLAALLGPDLTAIVNWGYGNPDYGYSLGPANIPTPADLLPPASDTTALLEALVSGTQVGVQDFVTALWSGIS